MIPMWLSEQFYCQRDRWINDLNMHASIIHRWNSSHVGHCTYLYSAAFYFMPGPSVIEGHGAFSRGRGLQTAIDSVSDPNALLFLCDVDMTFSVEFLRRCSLNAVPGLRVYFPVPFSWDLLCIFLFDVKVPMLDFVNILRRIKRSAFFFYYCWLFFFFPRSIPFSLYRNFLH